MATADSPGLGKPVPPLRQPTFTWQGLRGNAIAPSPGPAVSPRADSSPSPSLRSLAPAPRSGPPQQLPTQPQGPRPSSPPLSLFTPSTGHAAVSTACLWSSCLQTPLAGGRTVRPHRGPTPLPLAASSVLPELSPRHSHHRSFCEHTF